MLSIPINNASTSCTQKVTGLQAVAQKEGERLLNRRKDFFVQNWERNRPVEPILAAAFSEEVVFLLCVFFFIKTYLQA
jgi:hypothetical protein